MSDTPSATPPTQPTVYARRVTVARVLQRTAVGLAALIAFAFVTTLVLTRTDWGRERVRRLAISQIEARINGEVTIGRIRGNLLTGMTVDAFAIRDTAGQPFVAAEQVESSPQML